jgi:hypothetical protein
VQGLFLEKKHVERRILLKMNYSEYAVRMCNRQELARDKNEWKALLL